MSDGGLPRISLVTPSFNQGRFLEATLRSVLEQNYPNLEYIVVDGGSTDDSVAILGRYSDRLTWWVSEQDGGQTDAIRKGFSRATGEILNWLNSDDLLRSGALRAVAEAYSATGAEMIVGRDDMFRTDPDVPVARFVPSGYAFPDCLRFWDGSFRYHQPPTFFTRGLYRRAGGLDASLRYAMDYDLYCRMLALPETRVHYLDAVLAGFRIHSGAKTSRFKEAVLRELREGSQRYWPTEWRTSGVRRQMDRYCAECAVFQMAEALRDNSWGTAVSAFVSSCGYSMPHSLNFMARRIMKTLIRVA